MEITSSKEKSVDPHSYHGSLSYVHCALCSFMRVIRRGCSIIPDWLLGWCYLWLHRLYMSSLSWLLTEMESALEVLGGNQVRSGTWKTHRKSSSSQTRLNTLQVFSCPPSFVFFKENGCKEQEFVEMLGSTLEQLQVTDVVIRCYRNKTEVK